MRSVPSLLLASLLLLTLIAGCLGGDDDPPATDDEGEEPEDGKGSLRGTILTKNLETVTKASVRLVQDVDVVKEATSGDDGKYRIQNVEPGEYRLQVGAPCCKEGARHIVIEPDKETTADFQLEVHSDRDLQAPYIDRFEWTGFISCAAGIAVNAVNPCFLDPSSDNTHGWSVEPGVQAVVGAMDWNPVGGISGDSFRLRFEGQHSDGDSCGGRSSCTYGAAEGQSPIFLHVDQEMSAGPSDALPWDEVEEEYELDWRVFPSWDPNVAYQQEFTVYWEVHYFQDAPEDADPRPDM